MLRLKKMDFILDTVAKIVFYIFIFVRYCFDKLLISMKSDLRLNKLKKIISLAATVTFY